MVWATNTEDFSATDEVFGQHNPDWLLSAGWKHTLNNLRLLIQPFVAWWVLLPWLSVFAFPTLASNLHRLIIAINTFT